MAATIPRYVVLKSKAPAPNDGLVHYKDDGSVIVGEESVFSTAVKIEVEQAKTNATYVHLRFTYSNRYWAQKAGDRFITAESKQPEEDLENPACTLFEPSMQADALYLTHVASGGRVLIDEATSALHLGDGSDGFLDFEDWDELVKLPAHVAFMGDNGKYLQPLQTPDGLNLLQFGSADAEDSLSGHQVHLMPDGHVRLLSDLFNFFWRRRPSDEWIQADSPAEGGLHSLFWPVKIDDNTIAFRNARNENFCKRLTASGVTDCLAATEPTLTSQARFRVKELVFKRNISNVRFRMEDARVHDETACFAGEIPVTNEADVEVSIPVSIMYQDTRSYTFNRSFPLLAGVPTTIDVGVPFIDDKQGLTVCFEAKGMPLRWNTTATTTTTLTALGVVTVPAKATAMVEYVGTRSTCDVPFSYTQEDFLSSADAEPVSSEQVDGIYTAVNSYNFDFRIKSVEPIPVWTWT